QLVARQSQFERCEARNGGALYSELDLFLADVTIRDGFADISGGAVHSQSGAYVYGSAFEGNTAGSRGGAITTMSGFTIIAESSRFLDNHTLRDDDPISPVG